VKIKLTEVVLGKNYSRTFGVGCVKELADSMKLHGQITPLLIDGDKNLVAGYRRLAAAQLLEWDEIDVSVCLGDPKIVNLIENMNRTGLTLWEEIQAIRDVFGAETSLAEVARSLSKSRNWVRPRVEVWGLDSEFISRVRDGRTGVDAIRKAIALPKESNGPTGKYGIPKTAEVKSAVSELFKRGREAEARALSYSCGTITREQLLGTE